MLRRLIGLETEYAIRAGHRDGHRPSNLALYTAIIKALEQIVTTRSGSKLGGVESVFVENGGAFCYEFLPSALHGGLLEGATPECRGPSELLLFQKAQERLLIKAVESIGTETRAHPHIGNDGPMPFESVNLRDRSAPEPVERDLGLVKNCRDALGRIYGAQENYEATVASGPLLLLYRVGLVALLPIVLFVTLVTWVLILVTLLCIILIVPPLLLMMFLGDLLPNFGRWLDRQLHEDGPVIRGCLSAVTWLEQVLGWPLATAYALLLRATAFRRIRRGAQGFFISRSLMTGAGSVTGEGNFALSEKALALRSAMRTLGGSHSRSIIDTGNLLKALMSPAGLRIRPLIDLFRSRQRLQLGLSDSNMAQVAEYLKAGTTCLVIDMAEEGWLDDAPRPRHPVEAVHTVNLDPTLTRAVELRGGSSATALELQRWYLERARKFVASSSTASLEAREVIRLWSECLDALLRDPGSLVGRLDWVTKRWMVEMTAADSPQAVRKKVDIKYHELATGYFARLERAGLAPTLVTDEEVERALREPPESTPAKMRGRLIRQLSGAQKISVDWSSIRIGGRFGRLGGKVIQLDEYR